MKKDEFPMKNGISKFMLILLSVYSGFAIKHSYWTSKHAYSDPGIVLPANLIDGTSFYFDDFRESYSWMSQNTPEVI